jgi:hypothetical protein
MSDLTNNRWIIAKGLMFAGIVLLAGVQIVFLELWWQRALLLPICLWAACRFYYFLFYVLERYVGIEGRYTGIYDLLLRLWRRSG